MLLLNIGSLLTRASQQGCGTSLAGTSTVGVILPNLQVVPRKMRRVKRLLRKGSVLLQETRWCGGQEEILSQHLPGVTICSASPVSTELGNPSGGTSVLVPAGWHVGCGTVLVPGKAVAVLLADRGCQFYLVSVYTSILTMSVMTYVHSFVRGRNLTFFFFARCCLGKVPGGAPFSQLHKGDGKIARTGHVMQIYNQSIQTNWRQQQIPNCGGREFFFCTAERAIKHCRSSGSITVR